MQDKRKVREVSISEDDQMFCQNDGNEVGYLSLPSKNEMDRKIRELHGSLQDSSDEEPPFKEHTRC